jgi:hypothetical protein
MQKQILYFVYCAPLIRAEWQICASKNLQIGVVPEDNILNYLNRLGDYFLCLAINK